MWVTRSLKIILIAFSRTLNAHIFSLVVPVGWAVPTIYVLGYFYFIKIYTHLLNSHSQTANRISSPASKLPFSTRSISIVKDLAIVEQTPDYTLRDKSGWVGFTDKIKPKPEVGWYVGYLEKGKNT
jgi:hypothetical protein